MQLLKLLAQMMFQWFLYLLIYGSVARFTFALRNGYDYAIQVDADGQHIPSEIEKLLNL